MATQLKIEPEREDDKRFTLTPSVGWIDGEGEDVEFDLTWGNPYMRLRVAHKGEIIRETIDMREVVTDWVNQIVKENDG